MENLQDYNDADMPSNGHEGSDDQPAYRPPRRRILRSVLSVDPNQPPQPSADDQRRFFPPEQPERWNRSPWDYRQPPASQYDRGYVPARRRTAIGDSVEIEHQDSIVADMAASAAAYRTLNLPIATV